jgi:hypothetical protein
MLAAHIAELRTQLDKELKQTFLQIHKDVAYRISAAIEPGNDNDVRQMLIDEIENELLQNHETIEQGVSKCLSKLYSKLEKNPALTAVIHSLGERRRYGDPYRAVIGQYRNGEDSLLCSAKIYHSSTAKKIFESSIKPYLVTGAQIMYNTYIRPFGLINPYSAVGTMASLILSAGALPILIGYRMLNKHLKLLNEVQKRAQSSVETILQGLMEDITNNVHQTL